MTTLISVFLLAIVGLALTPSIIQSVGSMTVIDQTDRPGQTASQNATGIIWPNNLTGTSRTMMVLFPVFWIILMIAIPVAYVSFWLKGA